MTLLLGLFGLIPAAIAAGRARRTGHSETRYWIAFAASLAGSTALYAVVVLVAVTAFVGAGRTAAEASAVPESSATAPDGGAPVPAEPSTDSTPLDGTCTWVPAQGGGIIDVGVPPWQVPTSGTVTLRMTTNFGDMDLVLDRSLAPCATASFEHLSDQDFFDGTPCHRMTRSPGLAVLQCGDPTGTGTGGPAYRYAEEVSASTAYPRGTVAMAKSSMPSTTGSQFFLCYSEAQLPPDYTVVGTVDAADLGVLDSIVAVGIAGGGDDGAPASPVQILDVAVQD